MKWRWRLPAQSKSRTGCDGSTQILAWKSFSRNVMASLGCLPTISEYKTYRDHNHVFHGAAGRMSLCFARRRWEAESQTTHGERLCPATISDVSWGSAGIGARYLWMRIAAAPWSERRGGAKRRSVEGPDSAPRFRQLWERVFLVEIAAKFHSDWNPVPGFGGLRSMA